MQNNTITIVPLISNYIPHVVAMHYDFKKNYELHHEAFYYKTDEYVNTTLTNFLTTNITNQNFNCLIAKNETDQVVGYIFGFIHSRAPIYHIQKYGWLSNLYVTLNYRHLGIAKALYNKLEVWFNYKAVSFIEVNHHVNDNYVAEVYQKLGFKNITTTMVKRLN